MIKERKERDYSFLSIIFFVVVVYEKNRKGKLESSKVDCTFVDED